MDASSKHTFEWANDHISLNSWYASRHWTHRHRIKKQWHKLFSALVMDVAPFKRYNILLEYNSRLDPSNTITMIKLFEDTMVTMGKVKDDSKKYCREVVIRPDEKMLKKSYRITLTVER